MEPESSLPYLEPDAFSPHFTTLRSIIILSSHPGLGLPSGLSSLGFLTNRIRIMASLEDLGVDGKLILKRILGK
jgi:hypothetical protein